MHEQNLYQNVSIDKNNRSEVTITAEIPKERAENYRARALKKLGADVELPGFRKGHVPEKMLIAHIGEGTVWEEIAELAIADAYPKIVAEQSFDIIGRPSISVTKLAPGNPIAFKIEAALAPHVTLPDYKTLARDALKTPTDTNVTDKDVEDVLKNLRTNKWRIDNKDKAEKGIMPKDDELPGLTDELVRQLGNFENLEVFKAKLREDLSAEKQHKAKEKKRVAIGEKIIESATIPLPRILIEGELEGMLGQFKADITRAGLAFEDYLKRIEKTEADLRKEWEQDAAKRAKLQLILNKIAQTENISPEETMVEHEVAHLKEHVKDADPKRLRLYVMTVLQNEAVFQFLEKQNGDTSN